MTKEFYVVIKNKTKDKTIQYSFTKIMPDNITCHIPFLSYINEKNNNKNI